MSVYGLRNNGRGPDNGQPYVPNNHLDLRNGITRYQFTKANNPVIVQDQLHSYPLAGKTVMYSNESGRNLDIALYRAKENNDNTIVPCAEKSLDRFFLRSGTAYHTPLGREGWFVHIYGPVLDQEAGLSSQRVMYAGFMLKEVSNASINISLEPGDEDPKINVNSKPATILTDHWIEFNNDTQLPLVVTISRPHTIWSAGNTWIKNARYGTDNSHKLVSNTELLPNSVWRYHLPTKWFYVEVYETPKDAQGPGYLDSSMARPQTFPLYGTADSEVILISLYLTRGEIVVLLNPSSGGAAVDGFVVEWTGCTKISTSEVLNKAGIVVYTEDTSKNNNPNT